MALKSLLEALLVLVPGSSPACLGHNIHNQQQTLQQTHATHHIGTSLRPQFLDDNCKKPLSDNSSYFNILNHLNLPSVDQDHRDHQQGHSLAKGSALGWSCWPWPPKCACCRPLWPSSCRPLTFSPDCPWQTCPHGLLLFCHEDHGNSGLTHLALCPRQIMFNPYHLRLSILHIYLLGVLYFNTASPRLSSACFTKSLCVVSCMPH